MKATILPPTGLSPLPRVALCRGCEARPAHFLCSACWPRVPSALDARLVDAVRAYVQALSDAAYTVGGQLRVRPRCLGCNAAGAAEFCRPCWQKVPPASRTAVQRAREAIKAAQAAIVAHLHPPTLGAEAAHA